MTGAASLGVPWDLNPNLIFRADLLACRRKMRMKLKKSSQLVLATAASLLVSALITACSSLTVDFVFVASSKAAGPNNYGEMDVFEVNSESGRMRQIPTSPFPSGGRNPVAEAVSADNANLYVVNQDDNTFVQFVIGNDGKLYPVQTLNTPGIFPLAIAVSGLNVLVVDLYQPLATCNPAAPCSGSIAVFPSTAGSSSVASVLGPHPIPNGKLNYLPLCLTGYTYASSTQTWNCTGTESDVIVPTAINIFKSGAYVFVSAYDSTVNPNRGLIFAFAVGTSGVLTPANGGVPHDMGVGGSGLGVRPTAIASDPTSAYLYVTDSTNGIVAGYSLASGVLTRISDTPTGNQPTAIAVDPIYNYAYVANGEDSTITAYSVSNGELTRIASYAVGLNPVALGIDPSTNHFLYTANYLGGNVFGFEMNPTNGTLLNSQFSPYPSNAQPTAVTAIPHGKPQN
jgi:6-phosphogluconolactonase (cycloisomerase 2 family)